MLNTHPRVFSRLASVPGSDSVEAGGCPEKNKPGRNAGAKQRSGARFGIHGGREEI